jgi:hypothetical protein
MEKIENINGLKKLPMAPYSPRDLLTGLHRLNETYREACDDLADSESVMRLQQGEFEFLLDSGHSESISMMLSEMEQTTTQQRLQQEKIRNLQQRIMELEQLLWQALQREEAEMLFQRLDSLPIGQCLDVLQILGLSDLLLLNNEQKFVRFLTTLSPLVAHKLSYIRRIHLEEELMMMDSLI